MARLYTLKSPSQNKPEETIRTRLVRFEPLLSKSRNGRLRFVLTRQAELRFEDDSLERAARERENEAEMTLLQTNRVNFFFETKYAGYVLVSIAGGMVASTIHWMSTIKSLSKQILKNFTIEDFYLEAALALGVGLFIGAVIGAIIHGISRKKFVESLEKIHETEKLGRVFD
ncbi:hypothetical protein HZC08_00185 [Candidatus Micrarchaeota archaeon]|nr:hypothetical protein [Candidatus Micrarchaeota archaeon]